MAKTCKEIRKNQKGYAINYYRQKKIIKAQKKRIEELESTIHELINKLKHLE